ncbi:hypothetical protein AL755_14195 [Arthrobacter sp. ERGS1:01]|uniref:hypothetical protein n=1 Tax=Arthrobacter sp. ERGS1:01 TaxID=1704044 RepID=UPI0006B5B0C8|nr:hypothetical protein [Arthrobacter sp. ERGS1:01]ALE06345.1 hypothetical protein AL755_14195 [Arthrobacter sp. ERGS1:01]
MADNETSAFSKAIAAVSAFGPPLAVITALLVYFGWARSDAQARAMGLDVSLFGYSVQDYVLRSIRSLFVPLVLLAAAAILWVALDRWVTGAEMAARHHHAVRRCGLAAIAVGTAVATVTFASTFLQGGADASFLPYVMAAGVLLAAWGSHVRRQVPASAAHAAAGTTPSGTAPSALKNRSLESVLVFSVVTLLLFWGTADFAQAVGRGLAVQVEQNVGTMPRAAVYSDARLAIGVPQVTETSLGTAAAPLYKYQGLRLLVVSGGNYFFLHNGWTLRTGTVVVLPDDHSIRVELGN